MRLHTMWIARKGESTPELQVAWDEYTIDSYGSSEGFDAECKKRIEATGNDVDTVRYIDIEISEDALMAVFNTATISGKVIR